MTSTRRALPPAGWRRGTTSFTGLCGSDGLPCQTHRSNKALVDTVAQCTLMPSSYKETEPICISGVTGGSQQLAAWEVEISLTVNEWQKHPIVIRPEAP